jgi:hypothetical protein
MLIILKIKIANGKIILILNKILFIIKISNNLNQYPKVLMKLHIFNVNMNSNHSSMKTYNKINKINLKINIHNKINIKIRSKSIHHPINQRKTITKKISKYIHNL